MREELTKVEASLSPCSTICALITKDVILNLSNSKKKQKKKKFAHSLSHLQ